MIVRFGHQIKQRVTHKETFLKLGYRRTAGVVVHEDEI